MDMQKIVKETEQMEGFSIEGVNKDNEAITEGTKQSDMFEVFNSSIADYNKISAMAGNTRQYRDEIYNQINIYSMSLTGQTMSEKKVKDIRDIFKSMNKELENLTEAEMDLIFASKKIVFNIDNTKLKDGVTITDLKKAFFEAIISTDETDLVFNQAEDELKKINKKFIEDCDRIMASVDMSKELSDIYERMQNETDEKEKKRLNEIYIGMYNSLSLELIVDKINNKPLNVIKKECRKEFENIEKKARKVIINDKNSYFLDIKNLKSTMEKLFPDNKDEIKIFLFIIYKSITKRKIVPTNTVNFINYFVLGITKLNNIAFNKNEKMIEYKNRLLEVLNNLK